MSTITPRSQSRPRVLATDLDGTLIPLAGRSEHIRDLAELGHELAAAEVELVFSTGRHLASIVAAMTEFDLPRPGWIIADVGSTIYESRPDRESQGEWAVVAGYVEHLDSLCAALPIADLRERLAELRDLRPQEDEKQGRFKLSYYAPAERLDVIVAELTRRLEAWDAPYSLIASVDPFNNDGLIDLLPRGVSKAYALHWWAEHAELNPEGIVFAGDSGNDLAAMLGGYRTIVVANADRRIARKVFDVHRLRGWERRLFLAGEAATSGVLAGCRWFGLISDVGSDTYRKVDGEPLPLGATPITENRTRFRVWAPNHSSVAVEIAADGIAADEDDSVDGLARRRSNGRASVPLVSTGDGHFTGTLDDVGPGSRYSFRLDGQAARPDPRSRFQPAGPHGPSQVVDPGHFPWRGAAWAGVPRDELVIYELHVGSFTQEGTFAAAVEYLDGLRDLGITAIELMPVAQTPGRWNWGYDGVNLFAVNHHFGTPDDLRALVEEAHARGLAVLLDVVYNHVGPEGNYLSDFGPYASRKHHTPWGDALNFDGPNCDPVRQFVVGNALSWLREYHLDGLRLDAVHFMHDEGPVHILDEIRRAVTEYAATVEHPVHLVAETNMFDGDLLRARDVGDGETAIPVMPYDGTWCDDFAHAIYSTVAPETRLTVRPYHGATDVAEVLRHGCLYEGAAARRLAADDREQFDPAEIAHMRRAFVVGLQTHDLVGNEAAGRRLHQITSPAVQKAAAALTLLGPSIPLIFMGEETANASPFPFFTDFEDERLRRAVERGRREEYPQHLRDDVVSPTDPHTFAISHLGPSDDPTMLTWYRALLALRCEWRVNGWLDPARIGVEYDAPRAVFVLRYRLDDAPPVFVLTRLVAQSAAPIRVEIDGEVLLDSAQHPLTDGDSQRSLEISNSRAVVGRGRFRIEPVHRPS